jgi:hypothetical protein
LGIDLAIKGAERERELYAKAEAIREHQQRKFELAAREAADKKRELERQKVIESAAKMTGNVQSTRPDGTSEIELTYKHLIAHEAVCSTGSILIFTSYAYAVSNPLQGGGGSGGYRPTKRTIKSCCTGTDC